MEYERAALLATLGVVAALAALLVLPFLQYVLLALLLAYLVRPAYVRLAPRTGQRVAALSLMVVTLVLILVPFAVVLGVAIQQAAAVLRDLRSGVVDLGMVEAVVADTLGVDLNLRALLASVDLAAVLRSLGEGGSLGIVLDVAGLVGGISTVLIGLTVTAFLLYYLLVDGERFVRWTYGVSPLSTDVQGELYAEVDRITWAVIVGNVAVGIVQGVLTGFGFAAVGIPNVVFWSFVTTALALLPLIGASVVWFPAALFLLVEEQFVGGAFLLVYGAGVVSLSDNFLRPILVDRGARLNPGVVVLGIFGGVYAFGFMGLFFGPVLLGVLKALLVVLARERDAGGSAGGGTRVHAGGTADGDAGTADGAAGTADDGTADDGPVDGEPADVGRGTADDGMADRQGGTVEDGSTDDGTGSIDG